MFVTGTTGMEYTNIPSTYYTTTAMSNCYNPKRVEREAKASDIKNILSTYCGFNADLIHISVDDSIVAVRASKGSYSFKKIYTMDEWDSSSPLSIAYIIDKNLNTFKRSQNRRIVIGGPYIKEVIFNGPATIVFWDDGDKTVVKCENEPFDKEKGLTMAVCKKMFGNKGNYYNEIKKWVDD